MQHRRRTGKQLHVWLGVTGIVSFVFALIWMAIVIDYGGDLSNVLKPKEKRVAAVPAVDVADRDSVRAWLRDTVDSGEWEELRWTGPLKMDAWCDERKRAIAEVRNEAVRKRNSNAVSEMDASIATLERISEYAVCYIRYRTQSSFGGKVVVDHVLYRTPGNEWRVLPKSRRDCRNNTEIVLCEPARKVLGLTID